MIKITLYTLYEKEKYGAISIICLTIISFIVTITCLLILNLWFYLIIYLIATLIISLVCPYFLIRLQSFKKYASSFSFLFFY